MSLWNQFLWVIVPYVALTVFVVGHICRYNSDQMNWSAKSSEFLEKSGLKWASNLFHYGIIFAFFGHVMGILILKWVYDQMGINEGMYHLIALAGGVPAGIATGLYNTLGYTAQGLAFDYRTTIGPWFRSLPALAPEPGLMDNIPLGFKLHTLSAFGLFALWPFTRLVHVWSLPLEYLNRNYIIYRGYNPRKSTK